jgi:hypothetical protein
MFSHTKKILNLFAFLSTVFSLRPYQPILQTYSIVVAGLCTPPFFYHFAWSYMRGCIAQQDMLALFFFMAPFFCTVAPFFPVALSLLHCGAVFSLRQFFSPSGAIFLHRFAGLYNHSCCSKQKGKTTPTQSNGAI